MRPGGSIKDMVRHTPIMRGVQDLWGPVTRRLPVETIPAWLGLLQGIDVPKRSTRLPEPTPACGANIKIIFNLVKRVQNLPGDLAECGVYRGRTLVPTALYLAQHNLPKKVYGFDSFEGFGKVDRGGAVEDEYIRTSAGDFSNTSYDIVQRTVSRFRLADRVVLTKGYFQNTLHIAEALRFCFVHLDVDLHDSYKTCLQFFYPRMVPGGIILLDEYNDPPWPGCTRAVDDFLSDKPERLEEITIDNHTKSFIRTKPIG